MTTHNTTQQPQPQAGPIAQQLAARQSNSHQPVSPQAGQQVAVRHQQKRRPLAAVLMMALLILVSGVFWLAKLPWYIVAIPVMLSSIGLISIGYAAKWTGFSAYTSPIHPEHTEFQRSKTLWDWLQLLIIPFIIAAGGLWFSAQQHQTDLQIADDQQQEEILKTYLDNMSDLLLTQHLSTSRPEDPVREVARERTLTALHRLHDGRNRIVFQFLHEAHLIGIRNAVISLSNADLSNADLTGTDLSGIDLSGIDLSNASLQSAHLNGAFLYGALLYGAHLDGADLSNASLYTAHLNGAHLNGAHLDGAILIASDLRGIDLSGAFLYGANLDGAHLDGAHLDGAHLSGAFLEGADVSDADLSGADVSDADVRGIRFLTQQQLDTVYSCANVELAPTGLTCHHNGGVVTLTYWYTEAPAEQPVILHLIQQFEEQNPNIKINAVYQPFLQAQTVFETAAQAGNAPDVLRSDVSWVPQFASQRYLLNIDSFVSQSHLEQSDFMSAPLSYDRYNGHLYGLPQVTDFLALLYNKAEFAKSGIPSPPTTMRGSEGLEDDAIKVVRSKAAIYGFETTGTAYPMLPFLWAFGGGMIDQKNNILVNNPGSVEGLTFLLHLQNTDHVMPPQVDISNSYYSTYNNMVNDFMSGKTAMIFDGPWDLSYILAHGSAFIGSRSNLGIAAVPMGPSGDQPRSPVGGQSYVISASTTHPAEAYKFISFMSSTPSQIAIAKANHTLPTRQSAYQDSRVSGDLIISAFHSIQYTAITRPAIPQGGQLFDAFDPNIGAALEGVKSPTEALNAVADAWKPLLAGS